jgi:hypothetical protein
MYYKDKNGKIVTQENYEQGVTTPVPEDEKNASYSTTFILFFALLILFISYIMYILYMISIGGVEFMNVPDNVQ